MGQNQNEKDNKNNENNALRGGENSLQLNNSESHSTTTAYDLMPDYVKVNLCPKCHGKKPNADPRLSGGPDCSCG